MKYLGALAVILLCGGCSIRVPVWELTQATSKCESHKGIDHITANSAARDIVVCVDGSYYVFGFQKEITQ